MDYLQTKETDYTSDRDKQNWEVKNSIKMFASAGLFFILKQTD